MWRPKDQSQLSRVTRGGRGRYLAEELTQLSLLTAEITNTSLLTLPATTKLQHKVSLPIFPFISPTIMAFNSGSIPSMQTAHAELKDDTIIIG